MSVTLLTPPAAETENGEQRFVMGRVSWDAYLKISDALDDQPGLRMIYCDGRLVFVGKSRRHDWFAERLGESRQSDRARPRDSLGGRRTGDVIGARNGRRA